MSAGDTTLTITGNLTADPELRFTATGTAVAAFTVAASRRVYDQASGQWQDGDTLFLRCSAWRDLADHTAESLTKGMRVIVTGRLKQRTYETPEGDKRTVYEVDVEDLGPSLKWATAKIAKTSRDKVPHPADGPDPWQAAHRHRPGTATGRRSSPAVTKGRTLTFRGRAALGHLWPDWCRCPAGPSDPAPGQRPRKVLMCVITVRSLSPTAPRSRPRSRPPDQGRGRARPSC